MAAMKARPRIQIRFGKHSGLERYSLVHLTGRMSDGAMYELIDNLTTKQAVNIVKRLTNDLERFGVKM